MSILRRVKCLLVLPGAANAEGSLAAAGPQAEARLRVQQLDGVELIEHDALLSLSLRSSIGLPGANACARAALGGDAAGPCVTAPVAAGRAS